MADYFGESNFKIHIFSSQRLSVYSIAAAKTLPGTNGFESLSSLVQQALHGVRWDLNSDEEQKARRQGSCPGSGLRTVLWIYADRTIVILDPRQALPCKLEPGLLVTHALVALGELSTSLEPQNIF